MSVPQAITRAATPDSCTQSATWITYPFCIHRNRSGITSVIFTRATNRRPPSNLICSNSSRVPSRFPHRQLRSSLPPN